MKENTRQHYIPQTYLSNFVEKGKAVWVYNKNNSKKYLTSIDKICYTEDFYSLDEKTIQESGGTLNRLSIEKNFFAKNVEVKWSTLLKQLVDAVELNIQQNPRSILVLDDESKMKEFMMLGLRKIQGVSIRDFEQKFNVNPIIKYCKILTRLTS